jgi:hypothetical protein
VSVPEAWKAAPGGSKLSLWYRCAIDLPADWPQAPAELAVESADDAREFFLNGKKIGGLGDFPPAFRSGLGETKTLAVPADLLKLGERNLLAIRVFSDDARTGFNVAAPVLFAGERALRLAGKWEVRTGDDAAWANPQSAREIKTDAFAKSESAAEVRASLKRLQGDDGPLSPADLARSALPCRTTSKSNWPLASPKCGNRSA